jgi:membrane-associated phospholipid phosphatase
MPETLVKLDHALFFLINGLHHPAADWFFLAITQLGNGWVVAPLLLLTVFLKVPRRRLAQVVLCGVVGLTLCGIVNSQIKHTVSRSRPSSVFGYEFPAESAASDSPRQRGVHLVGIDYCNCSFPSGHTNTAFAAAMFLALLLGGWFYLSYVAALFVGYSRVYLGVHFPLDVAAGALAGSGIMWVVMRLFERGINYIHSGFFHDKQ